MHTLILVGYWFLFWFSFLINPFKLYTSELASTQFPHWLWLGRKWRASDDLYYKHPACIPFLSQFYPLHFLSAKLSKYLSLDNAFRLFTLVIIGHSLLSSFLAYKVMGIFGAITLTYAGYCIKPQTPSFMYTACWMPGMLIAGPLGWISCGMAILGGYWPILVYFMPLAAIMNPSCLWGILLGLPQIVLFLWYWPRSVRAKEKVDRNFGRLPWWKLIDLVIPTKSVGLTNGVHYPEVAMYCGIAPILIWHVSWWWISFLLSILVTVGRMPQLQRIPTRALYLLTLSLAYLSSLNISKTYLHFLIILQAFLLLRNSSIYPSFPFSQWWTKPSRHLKDYTGYITGTKLHDYKGAFALA